ncbi:MAG: hypothetical protein K2G52_06540 [Muribaculaceae bacterium]|nr:hypothetical protein [Muribaculaceae bacterium]
MKTAISTIRIIILFSLGIVAVFGILCSPADDSPQWLTDFFTSKAVGLLALWALIHIFRIWKVEDPAVRAFDESQREGDKDNTTLFS